MSDELIDKVVQKLEKDSIYPYASLRPTLAVIHKSADNMDDGEKSYLKSLQKTAGKYGAIVNDIIADTPLLVAQSIQMLQQNIQIQGILIISDYGNINRTLYNMIPAHLDIDGLSASSLGNLIGSTSPIAYRNAPCTAVACMKIMEEWNHEQNKTATDFSGQFCDIFGRSIRVGRALAEILTQKNMTVTLYHSKSYTYSAANAADYCVSAIGKPNYWNEETPLGYRYYRTTCFIDVGMNVNKEGKLCGDIDRDWYKNNVEDKYGSYYITPVVGGVGRVTTTVVFAKLFNNAAEFFRTSTGVLLESLPELHFQEVKEK